MARRMWVDYFNLRDIWVLFNLSRFRIFEVLIIITILRLWSCITDTFNIQTCAENQELSYSKVEGTITISDYNFTEFDHVYSLTLNGLLNIFFIFKRQYILKLSSDFESEWLLDTGSQFSHYLDSNRLWESEKYFYYASDSTLI